MLLNLATEVNLFQGRMFTARLTDPTIVALAATSAAYWPEVRGSLSASQMCYLPPSTKSKVVAQCSPQYLLNMSLFWGTINCQFVLETEAFARTKQSKRQVYIMKPVWAAAAYASLYTRAYKTWSRKAFVKYKMAKRSLNLTT